MLSSDLEFLVLKRPRVNFFNKPASRLTASEAALLAAVLPNPIRYRVNKPTGYVMRRQQWILRQMGQIGGEHFLEANRLY
ncbi:hypothetical protein DZJ_12790 [Dickeya ananatis]